MAASDELPGDFFPNGTSTFVALVQWMDETLVCEELLFLSQFSSVRLTDSSFMSELDLVCKSHHFFK